MKKSFVNSLFVLCLLILLLLTAAVSASAAGVPVNPYADVTYPDNSTARFHCTSEGEVYSIALPVFWAGQSYRVDLHAENAPESWQRYIYAEIPGMSFNSSTGVLSGTPTTFSRGRWTMRAINASGKSNTIWLSYCVLEESQKPAISTASLPNGIVGGEYKEYVKFTGYAGDSRSWYHSSGTLPPGLSFGSSGVNGYLRGTPTAAGTYTFTLCMENAAGIAEKEYTIEILSALSEPQITNAPTYALKDETYSFQMTAALDSRADNDWQTYTKDLPEGLSISKTGLISGTPTTASDYNYAHIYVESKLYGARNGDSIFCNLPVYERPEITIDAAQSAAAGQQLSIPLAATGSSGLWDISGEPTWLYLSDSSVWGTPPHKCSRNL